MKNIKQRLLLIAGTVVVTLVMAGCSTAPASAATCGIVVGDGNSGSRDIKNVIYPNEAVTYDDSKEDVHFFPCNPRTFIVNPAGQTNANGQEIGDRHFPVLGRTKDGTEVKIWLNSYWTPSQERDALENFYALCLKFMCYSTSVESGDVNFATAGWNGMLSESYSPALDVAGRNAAPTVDDQVWKKDDPEQLERLGREMSAEFMKAARQTTGYNTDLFCGSGNSGWSDPSRPGKGEFTCTQVRITVTKVEPVNSDLNKNVEDAQKAASEEQLNQQRLKAARALYGSQAEYWLGMQDTIEKCNEGKQSQCIITFGSGQVWSPPAPSPQ